MTSITNTPYDPWAEIYDAVYAYVRDDIPFYVEEAVATGSPVLELGCGTGRVSMPMAQAGVQVVGLDYSEAMLAVARRKCQQLGFDSTSVELMHADMRDFALDQQFDLVTIPFRGFLALLSVEDQIRALARIREHLTPDGRLVFNVFVPDIDMLLQDGDRSYHLRDVTDPETGKSFVLWQQTGYDNHNQVLATRLTIEELGDDMAVVRKMYRDFQLRYAHRWELHHLLTSCGFEIVDLYGDFDRLPFDEFSNEMVWVARKAQSA